MAPNMMRFYVALALLLLSLASSIALGQALSDPTRPLVSVDGIDSLAGIAVYPQVKGLQSVLISPSHCAAIIDGKTILLGGKYGSEKMIEVNERGVVLQSEYGGRRTLTLFPAVGMKITVPNKDQQAVKCGVEQSKQSKSPAKQAGQKEKK